MHRNVEILIGRLATDSKLRRRFAGNPEALLRELSEQGLELSGIELEALAATHPQAFRALAAALDARLRRLEPRASEPGSEIDHPNPPDPLNLNPENPQ